ncbi:MAG TPA: ATP-binding protein [Caulobacteraceae bacterium]|nr:ATP-binding protein [Caulobacteraceae bacterium]
MKIALVALAAAAAAVLAPVLATAQARHAAIDPAYLAREIESRADRTSFADLERFGEAARRERGEPALAKLEHVAWIFLNQSEFDRFDRWNAALAERASDMGGRRYAEIARINALKARYDQGDTSTHAEIARLARSEPDWFARIHAAVSDATLLIEEDRTGEALKEMYSAEELIPEGDPAANAAETDIWGTIGLGLMSVDDLDGAARAFQRADFQFADPSYPRPDFDDVYNMAHMAIQQGDAALAEQLAGVHHRLALRSDLPHLRIWDQNLCAMVADSFQAPKDVMACLSGLDARLRGADFLAPDLLPLRAIAEARLGDIPAAKSDLARIQALVASHRMQASGLSRAPEVQAEILMAQGEGGEAFAALRSYERGRSVADAQRFNVGVHQITSQLHGQLETSRRAAELQKDVTRFQRWILIALGVFVLCAAGVVVWQRRAALRLRAERLRAEAANRSKSEFLANMSHEIRTPLNGVVGVAEMLAQAGLPQREREMVEIIKSSGQSLERLLSDVLDLARVEAGKLTIERAPFHAGDLVRAVAGLARLRADEKSLKLDVEVAPALEGWFIGDATRVRQILTNLVSNAVKFTSEGSVTIDAETLVDGRLRFSVSDTGVGFDATARDRVFGRFQQADGSITRRFGGTGLGLAISRQLALLMGGEIDCWSAPGEGARFWFVAPFERAAAPAAAEQGSADLGAPDRALKVLVADDHATNQTVIRLMLDQFGVETTVVENGAEALASLGREAFDLVFMDMQMPVMDGLEATRRIREAERAEGRPRTPIVMLTANALPEQIEAGRRAGADAHLAKPVTAASLAAALNMSLEAKGAERAVA